MVRNKLEEALNRELGSPEERITKLKDVKGYATSIFKRLFKEYNPRLAVNNVAIVDYICEASKHYAADYSGLFYQFMVPKSLKKNVPEEKFVKIFRPYAYVPKDVTKRKGLIKCVVASYEPAPDIIFIRPMEEYKFISSLFHEVGHRIIWYEINKKADIKNLDMHKAHVTSSTEEYLCDFLSENAVYAMADMRKETRGFEKTWKKALKETVLNREYAVREQARIKKKFTKILKGKCKRLL